MTCAEPPAAVRSFSCEASQKRQGFHFYPYNDKSTRQGVRDLGRDDHGGTTGVTKNAPTPEEPMGIMCTVSTQHVGIHPRPTSQTLKLKAMRFVVKFSCWLNTLAKDAFTAWMYSVFCCSAGNAIHVCATLFFKGAKASCMVCCSDWVTFAVTDSRIWLVHTVAVVAAATPEDTSARSFASKASKPKSIFARVLEVDVLVDASGARKDAFTPTRHAHAPQRCDARNCITSDQRTDTEQTV